MLDRAPVGAREAAEDEERGVDRGLEAARRGALRGLAPQGLLGRVDDEVVALGEDGVERPGQVLGVEVGQQRARVPPLLDRHRLVVGEPDPVDAPGGAARAEPERTGDVGRRTLLVDAQQAGGRGEAAPAHVLGERREVEPALDAGAGDEGALALDPLQQPARHQAVDGLADRRPRHVVGGHQLALGRDGDARAEVAQRELGQHVAQLGVLGPGAVVDPAGHRCLSTGAGSIGTVWYVPVGAWPHARRLVKDQAGQRTPP